MSERERAIQKLEEQARELGLSSEQVQKMKEAILASATATTSHPSVAAGTGVPFGKYALIERLGNGILSKMYKAISPEGQEVVLKIMRPDFMKAPFLERFEEVSRKMLDVFHPNWIISHDVIREPGLALVSEYLDGAPFSINDEPVPIEAVAFILREILTGLSYLHEKGEHHGNIKPSNVILCRDGAVKLLDSGMQKVLNSPREKISSVWYGTLSHMAPETHHGEWGPKADIYSAGLLAWELLAGRPACPHQNIDAQRRWHSSMGPMAIELVRKDVPKWLASTITVMCVRDPLLRPAHAMEILDKWMEGYDSGVEQEHVDIPLPPIEMAQISLPERPRVKKRRERQQERQAGRTRATESSIPTKPIEKISSTSFPIRPVVQPTERNAELQHERAVEKQEKASRIRQVNVGDVFTSIQVLFQEQLLSMNLPNGTVQIKQTEALVLTQLISQKGFLGSLISIELEFVGIGSRGYILLSYDLILNLFNRYSDQDAELKSAARKNTISHGDKRSMDRFLASIFEYIRKTFAGVQIHGAKLAVPDTQGQRHVGVFGVGPTSDFYGMFAVGIPVELCSLKRGSIESTQEIVADPASIMEELLDVALVVRCTLPTFLLPYQAIQQIQVGSILPLPKNWDAQLRVIINNTLSFVGEYGVEEGSHAVLIHSQPKPKK